MSRGETASPYDEAFFSNLSAGSRESAEAILPFVQELVRPESVLDVGCGSGEWSRAWNELGVADVALVDNHIDQSILAIRSADFTAVDLTKETMVLGRRFDLVSCIEVGEHLPESAAGRLVKLLVDHGDVVLFSAAIPGQGGVHHVNEQWPKFWIDLFATRDFEVLDVVRPYVWDDDRAVFYYRQNMILFADRARRPEIFLRCNGLPSFGGRSVVHPQLYQRERHVRELVRDLRFAIPSAVRRRAIVGRRASP